MSQSLNIRGSERDVFNTSSHRKHPLGTRMHLTGGRVFRFAKNGSSQITVGHLVQSPENKPELANINVNSVHQPGVEALTLTVALNTIINLNDYEDGLVYINDGPGQGYMYPIRSNAESQATATTLILYIDNGIQGTLTTSSEATVIKNRYRGTVLATTNPNEPVLGVAVVTVAANQYYWLQTAGPCIVLQDGTLFSYKPVTYSNSVQGAVRNLINVIPSTGSPTEEGTVLVTALGDDGVGRKETLATISGIGVIPPIQIGYAIDPRADTEFSLINLTLDT